MNNWIDLTYPIEEGMTTFPSSWHPKVEISQLGRLGIECRETRKIVLGTHTGTHCDAPLHFIKDGMTVDQISLDLLIGKAKILDFSDLEERTEISLNTLKQRIEENNIPRRLILKFDWDKHWGYMKFYQDHPFLSVEAATWLVEQGVELLGMDTPQPDNPLNDNKNDVAPIHKILLGKNVILVEYLSNLQKLSSEEIDLIVAPLFIQGADGAPIRCFARDL